MKLFAKQRSSGDGRVFRSGVWSAAIAAAVIVLAVLVNLIVRAIPSRYTEFDLSEAGLYTLSESSRQVADDLTQDVAIYYLAQTGNEDQIISKLLDQYAAQSSHITWELKDPAVYPTFAAQYGVQDLTSGGLILVCGEQSKVLDAAELYDYDYSDYAATGAANVTFDGESRITSAIYQLTSGESRHVYYTTNHGEQALTSTLTDALEGQNLSVSSLDLLTDTIPDDCDLLIIDDLGTELTTEFVRSAFYQIVNTRLMTNKKTIISTNLSPAELSRRYGANTLSRIEGAYRILPFFGDDIRKQKK